MCEQSERWSSENRGNDDNDDDVGQKLPKFVVVAGLLNNCDVACSCRSDVKIFGENVVVIVFGDVKQNDVRWDVFIGPEIVVVEVVVFG